MPDETTTTEAVEMEQVTTEPVVETQPTAPETTEKPHPLTPGGPRFEQVYGDWRAAQREAALLREENERLRKQPAQPQQPTQTYSQDQLQAYVDAGKITPAQMAGQLALQAKAEAKAEMRQEFDHRERTTAALNEVNGYLDKVPDLRDTASEKFRQVTRAAWDIAEETGMNVQDPRVQRRALREALGPLDRITTVQKARDFNRDNADTHTEVGGGGGTRQPSTDPLKNVEKARIDHWTKLGYTRAQMLEEAKFIQRPMRNR